MKPRPLKDIRYGNLRAEMARRNIGPSILARMINREPSQVSQIAGMTMRKGIGDDLARQIETALGLPHFWLDQPNHDEPPNTDNVHFLPKRRDGGPLILEPVAPWDSDTPLEDDEVALPLYKEIELAAGSGRTAVQEVKGRLLRFSHATLRMCGVEPAQAICAPVSGNSMEPLILHGSTIGIDRAMTRVIDGEIYALEHDGMLRVKFLYRLPGGGLRIRSFNREEYPDEDLNFDSFMEQQIRIIGRVFWWSTVRPLRSPPLV